MPDASDYAGVVGGELTGTVGGRVYARGPHGPYAYDLPSKINPNTQRQATIRFWFGWLSTFWTTLSLPIREGWQIYARNLTVPKRTGACYTLTGRQHFIASISFKAYLQVSPNAFAPTIFTRARLQVPVFGRLGTNFVTVTFALDDDWRLDDDAAFALFCSRPQSAGVNHFRGPYVLAGVTTGDPVTPPINAIYPLPFFPTSTKRRIFLRCRVVLRDNRLSPSVFGVVDYP